MGDKAASSPVVMISLGEKAAVTSGTPKKAAAGKSKNLRVLPTHPKTAEMVNSAIKALKKRSGSSAQAIKNYMVGTYKIDAEKKATFIKNYLKATVASGVLIQTKGKGAGSFKLASAKAETTKPKVKAAPKTAALVKKAAVTKKSVAAKNPAATASKKVPQKKAAITSDGEKK